MAKNKNRERKHQQRSSVERSAERAKGSPGDTRNEEMKSQVGPSEVAHKERKRSFGHN